MSFRRLAEFEKHKREAEAAEREKRARLDLRKAVKDVLPADLKKPRRPKGRTAVGGISRREVERLRAIADRYLAGEAGLRQMEADVLKTAVVILLEDGLMGTEPWRAAGAAGGHGGIVAANARQRYLENAARLLADLRKRVGVKDANERLLEGVIDAELTDGEAAS